MLKQIKQLTHVFHSRIVVQLGVRNFAAARKPKPEAMVRVLNVAEKNDVAKNVANILSHGARRMREGYSVYNKIYEFQYQLPQVGGLCQMVMTSVSGHLTNYDFTSPYTGWRSCDPGVLFQAPIVSTVNESCKKIRDTLKREVRACQHLIIWTDCDREGENIGFEIIKACQEVNPSITLWRAHFSEITVPAITRAINNLSRPDKKISDAVDVRQQLDLRIGAAFTRFLTLNLQERHIRADKEVVSYGSCQFPTLGFVVDRWKQIQQFQPEAFWYLSVAHKKDDIEATFNWKRQRLFDEQACLAIYARVCENLSATVKKVESRHKTKLRPQPMDTVALEKLASSKLKINAKKAMTIAEKLYTSGFISYPRTETNKFPPELNLSNLVILQTASPEWGAFAERVANNGPSPRNGNKSDQAHPPIHPTKFVATLTGDEKKVYALIARHFLACCDRDAVGAEMYIEIEINEELFNLKGLRVEELNYLEVYVYEKWFNKQVPRYVPNEVFVPSSVLMNEGSTTAPELLTESQLIALMDKHGIGTDATHAEHIEKIKERRYISETPERRLKPEGLGIGLVEAYDLIGYEMSKPHLRAALENELRQICAGLKNPNEVLNNQITQYKRVFQESQRKRNELFNKVAEYVH